jgi:hypothetical protein
LQLASLSLEQEFYIRLKATLIDGYGEPRQRFNITTVQEPLNKNQLISTTQEFTASSNPFTSN